MKEIEKAEQETQGKEEEVRNSIRDLKKLKIKGPEDEAFAAEILAEVKEEWRQWDTKRKSITSHLVHAKKQVDELFKPALTALAEAEKILKDKLVKYAQLKEQNNEEALKRAASASTAEEAQEALDTHTDPNPPQGISIRYKWKAEIQNFGLIPFEFLQPDFRKMEEYANHPERRESPYIPGVKFVKMPITTVRSKK